MNKTQQIIYVPGISDKIDGKEAKLVSRLQKTDIEPHYFSVGWSNNEPFKSKLDRLIKLIDDLSDATGQVSLIGTSAGAGLALNAYMARPQSISGVVFVCGELTGFAKINPRYFKENPAFKDSMALADANLGKLTNQDKVKMLSVHPIFDEIVPIKETKIPGVKSQTVFSVFHVLTIGLMLTIYKSIAINFLKNGVK